MMRIGLHELEITPPFPVPLAGFGLARMSCHEGVHDPLHVGCAVFESGDEIVALVSCEVIGLTSEFIQQVRSALSATCDFPAERIVITCTHTHGAPVIGGAFAPYLMERVVKVIRNAWEDRRPRRLVAGSGRHPQWVGFNRRHLQSGFLPVDREVSFLGVLEPRGELRAVLYHYACHPSILGPDNLLITADWPEVVRRSIRERMGADVAVLYLKGTEGDINTGYCAGRSSLGIAIPTRTYDTAEWVGKVIAETIFKGWKRVCEPSDATIRFASRILDLRYQKSEGMETARQAVAWWDKEIERIAAGGRPEGHLLDARVEQAYARFHVTTLEEIVATGQQTLAVEQTAFRLGKAGFLSFPGEFFVESGLQVKRKAKAAFAFPLGITNDYRGYFPPENEFPSGGYEVATAKFMPETADEWTSTGLELLNSLF